MRYQPLAGKNVGWLKALGPSSIHREGTRQKRRKKERMKRKSMTRQTIDTKDKAQHTLPTTTNQRDHNCRGLTTTISVTATPAGSQRATSADRRHYHSPMRRPRLVHVTPQPSTALPPLAPRCRFNGDAAPPAERWKEAALAHDLGRTTTRHRHCGVQKTLLGREQRRRTSHHCRAQVRIQTAT